MSLRIESSSIRGYLLIIAYGCAILLVAVTSARVGLSHYFSSRIVNSFSRDAATTNAIYFDRDNPDAYMDRGRMALREKDYPLALICFTRAGELRERDLRVWLGLGHAFIGLKDLDGARNAYQTAITHAPNYAVPNRYMGLALLDAGATDEAFEYLSKAAEQDTSLLVEVLSLAREHYADDQEAMRHVLVPGSREARVITARYVIEHGFMTDAVMAFLTGNEISDKEKDDFVRLLIAGNDPHTAYQIWITKTVPASAKPADGEAVFDGGFEIITSADDSGFGWQIDQNVSNTAVAIDTELSHSGSRSLHIRFSGNIDVGSNIVSQMVLVKPFQSYRLTFAVRSSDLTSGGLPVIVVNAGNSSSPRGSSPLIKATDGKWVTITVDFRTNQETTAWIALERANCESSPCPIFGEMSLDDFSIKEINKQN